MTVRRHCRPTTTMTTTAVKPCARICIPPRSAVVLLLLFIIATITDMDPGRKDPSVVRGQKPIYDGCGLRADKKNWKQCKRTKKAWAGAGGGDHYPPLTYNALYRTRQLEKNEHTHKQKLMPCVESTTCIYPLNCYINEITHSTTLADRI